MKLSELIAELAGHLAREGNVEVGLAAGGDTYDDVTAVTLADHGRVVLRGEG